jgi:hypothetical protein
MEPDMGYYRIRYTHETKNRNERNIFTPEQQNKTLRTKEYQPTASKTKILQTNRKFNQHSIYHGWF